METLLQAKDRELETLRRIVQLKDARIQELAAIAQQERRTVSELQSQLEQAKHQIVRNDRLPVLTRGEISRRSTLS
jgi:hypothetical protein